MAINPAILDPRSDSLDARSALIRRAGYWLHLVRALEGAGRRLYLQGRLPGSFYDGYGQEATAVGAGLALAPRDIACPVIRDLAVHLIRGITPAEVLRHYLGKTGGPMDGRDGNVHIGSFERGTIPMISHLPEMLPVVMGVALSRMRRGEPSAALGFCGDGSSSGGVFHETLNLAARLEGAARRDRRAQRLRVHDARAEVPGRAGDRRPRGRLRHSLVERRRQRRAGGALARRRGARARPLGSGPRARRAVHLPHARPRRS